MVLMSSELHHHFRNSSGACNSFSTSSDDKPIRVIADQRTQGYKYSLQTISKKRLGLVERLSIGNDLNPFRSHPAGVQRNHKEPYVDYCLGIIQILETDLEPS